MFSLSDTICAICTPRGIGSIAAIRISGADSWNIASKVFKYSKVKSQKSKIKFSHMQAQHGFIVDNEKLIDEVIVLPYKSPNSFTAEDVVEIFCHGGMQVSSMVLDICLKNGARLAKNGEFSFRAFINGRIDLTEAEAINELINADSEKGVMASSEVLSGSLKNKVVIFKEKILQLLASIESAIEFPTDVAPTNKNLLVNSLSEINSDIGELIERSKEGQLLRTGIRVSIVGLPNVGKSSLLNQLLESDRAIVTDIPGTTRDTLEEKVVIDGYPIVFTDTAGIRDLSIIDTPEHIGIEKSKKEIEKSDIALVVIDLAGSKSVQHDFLSTLNGKQKLIVGNKMDLVISNQLQIASSEVDITISAKDGTNIADLKKLIVQKIRNISNVKVGSEQIYVNERQKELLIQCSTSIEFALKMINDSLPEDIVADELKKSLANLDQVCGSHVNEEIVSGIFEKFCIGK